MLRAFLLTLSLLLGLNLPAASADVPPDVLARTTSQEVLAVLKADKDIQRGDLSKIYELVEAKVLPNFDFNRMTQLAMGRHWPKASAKQKQMLVAEFRNLLVRTYATSLTEFSSQSVEFKNFSMKPEDTEVIVRSEIRQPGGQPISIDYSVYKTAFGWKVYDVTIDNVSLVTNYRATFANSIRQSGIDGLVKTLSAQSAKGASQPASAKPAARSGS